MGAVEARFADIIWNNAPIPSSKLAKLAEGELGWKKSTSFTVLKRLCDKGIFKNEGGSVAPLISRDDFYSLQSHRFVEQTFDGSLPAFLAAFCSSRRLDEAEVAELRRMVESYDKEEKK